MGQVIMSKIYDGGIFSWHYGRGYFGIVNVSDLESEIELGEFWDNLPRSISVRSHKTGAVKTFEFTHIEDDVNIQRALYRAYVNNVGNVTLCIYNR